MTKEINSFKILENSKMTKINKNIYNILPKAASVSQNTYEIINSQHSNNFQSEMTTQTLQKDFILFHI